MISSTANSGVVVMRQSRWSFLNAYWYGVQLAYNVTSKADQLLQYALSWLRCAAIQEEEEQSPKRAPGQPWVWSVSDFISLATEYAGGWPVLSLTISSSHWQCTVSVLITAEWNRDVDGAEISIQISALAGFEPRTSWLEIQHANH